MSFWIISGGSVLAAWALLSVMGGELVRRTQNMQNRTQSAAKRPPHIDVARH